MIKIEKISRTGGNEYEVQFKGWVGDLPYLEFEGTFFFKPDEEFDPENDNDYIKAEIRKSLKNL